MENLKYKGFIIAMFILSLVSCGDDSQKENKGATAANARALEYYSQFINSVRGLETNKQIIGRTYNSSQSGNSDLNLVMDSNYSYKIYIEDNFNTNQSFSNDNRILVANGSWRVDGDILYLANFGKTLGTYNTSYNGNNNYNIYNNNNNNFNNQNLTNSNCLRIEMTNAQNLIGANGSSVNTLTGTQLEFCII